ncbi:MAG: hypothetical protein L6V88_07640 [Anaerotruncus sp.]|nr:MAG: hypothetical protein L6V88_07640 [Anaerotruncus sp.]
MHFRVWAPDAVQISVVGDFNDWDEHIDCMHQISPGIWETEVNGVKKYDCYKYAITAKDGRVLYKADPYGFHSETRPGTASKIYELGGYKWHDKNLGKIAGKGQHTRKAREYLRNPFRLMEAQGKRRFSFIQRNGGGAYSLC